MNKIYPVYACTRDHFSCGNNGERDTLFKHKSGVFLLLRNYPKTLPEHSYDMYITEDSCCLIRSHSYVRPCDPKWFKTPVMHFLSRYSLIFTGFVPAAPQLRRGLTDQTLSHSFRSNVDYSHWLASSQTNPESRREFYMPRDAREKLVSSQAQWVFVTSTNPIYFYPTV